MKMFTLVRKGVIVSGVIPLKHGKQIRTKYTILDPIESKVSTIKLPVSVAMGVNGRHR